MGACANCSSYQSRLCKGKLCKECFNKNKKSKVTSNKNDHPIDNMEYSDKDDDDDGEINKSVLGDRSVINMIKESMLEEKAYNKEIIMLLKDQIDYLKNEIIHKNTLIETLMFEIHDMNAAPLNDSHVTLQNETPSNVANGKQDHLPPTNNCIPMDEESDLQKNTVSKEVINNRDLKSNNYQNVIVNNPQSDKHTVNDEYRWNVVDLQGGNKKISRDSLTTKTVIPLSNKYSSLSVDEDEDIDELNNRIYNDDANIQTNSHITKQVNTGIVCGTTERNDNSFDENSRRPKIKQTVPGNSTYANMTNNGKKVCLFGASIVQRINIRDFNNCLENKNAIKSCFPGATVSRGIYHMKPTLEEDNPDIVVLSFGTNNLTKKKHQIEEDIVNEIIQMVEECRNMGVNEIFVAGLIVRRGFYNKINVINKMLERQASISNFTYIDNNNITNQHLRNDGLHLEQEGTVILAKNFIKSLNKISIFDYFY